MIFKNFRPDIRAVVSVLIGISLFGILVMSPWHDPLVAAARSAGEVVRWDLWHRGKFEWNRFSLEVPTGEYGWVETNAGTLVLFSRRDQVGSLITLYPAGPANVELSDIAKSRCVRFSCSQIDRKDVQLNDSRISEIRFVLVDERGLEREEGILSVEGGIRIEVSAPRSAFSVHRASAMNLAEQIVKK